MKIEIITNLEAFTSLEKEWNAIHKDSASAVPFLRHEYLLAWWQTLGGGEWPQGELYIVTARHNDGALAGIARVDALLRRHFPASGADANELPDEPALLG